LLDGDELREIFRTVDKSQTSHDRASRVHLAMQYAQLCRMMSEQGITVVIATISMFNEVHAWNRMHIPGYFEAYLNVPIEELRIRDPKSLYKRYDLGEVINVAGLDLAVDEPAQANFISSFDDQNDPAAIANLIFHAYLEEINK